MRAAAKPAASLACEDMNHKSGEHQGKAKCHRWRWPFIHLLDCGHKDNAEPWNYAISAAASKVFLGSSPPVNERAPLGQGGCAVQAPDKIDQVSIRSCFFFVFPGLCVFPCYCCLERCWNEQVNTLVLRCLFDVRMVSEV